SWSTHSDPARLTTPQPGGFAAGLCRGAGEAGIDRLKILDWGIVKTFTMNSPEIARDEHGRLYSPRFRALMQPLEVDTTGVEAMAALRIAGKFMHLLQ